MTIMIAAIMVAITFMTVMSIIMIITLLAVIIFDYYA